MSTPSEELVMRVIEVTGAGAEEAQRLLTVCANDVETAVALYFEQGGDESNSSAVAAPHAPDMPALDNEEDGVRAPIAPMREQLVGPEDDNFLAAGPTSGARMTRSAQRVKVKVCPLRDFAREGALMEEQLQAATANIGNSAQYFGSNTDGGRRRRARAAAMVAVATDVNNCGKDVNSSRLEDLYRPPTDIAYAGTFQTARRRATELKRWLLVNVQSDNFDSQLLNRDVWSDQELRLLMLPKFLLWQVDSDSSEGRRFVAFYHCGKLPYVCIIDPRTGEEMWRSSEPKIASLSLNLKQFLLEHKDFSSELDTEDANLPSTSKRCTITEHNILPDLDDDLSTCASSTISVTGNATKRSKLMELSEEEQIALAIRNSMQENGAKNRAVTPNVSLSTTPLKQRYNNDGEEVADDESSDFDSIEEFGDDDTKTTSEHISYEEQLGTAKHELTALKLRLLNTQGIDEVVQLRWPSDTPLQTLRLYIAQRHSHIPQQGTYKLICAFPRKSLEATDDVRTLKELGLHPSANLHVTLDD